MMKFVVETPIKARVEGTDQEIQDLKATLTYMNMSAVFMKQKIERNFRWKQRDEYSWAQALDEAKSKVKSTLVFKDNRGFYVRPASIPYLNGQVSVTNKIKYPEASPVKWKVPVPYKPYPYQSDIVQNLLAEKHGCVSAATGTGKTFCIMMLAQRLGLKTVVAVPSASIFNEMLEAFTHHFGKDMVGGLGDGKKDTSKLFTIAIYRSLSLLKEGKKGYQDITNADVWIGDESHVIGAPTLEKISNELFYNTPYRFFFSGTQVRGDGTDKLLQSVIGKQVYTITTAEAIKGGYICDHNFKIITVQPSLGSPLTGDDPLQVKRDHFLYNDNIADFIAKLCLASIGQNKKVLILVDEVRQVVMLAERFALTDTKFAYAVGSPDQRLKDLNLPPMDANEAVEAFNLNQYQILIGTSCISTGTNIYPMHITCNWQGSGSEVRSKQGAVGRSVRLLHKSKYASLNPEKKSVTIIDFDVDGVRQLKSQLQDRIEYYQASGTKIDYIKLS
jgi:superfamily II DNA or RNA helicase